MTMQTKTVNSVQKESNKKLIIHYKFDVSTVYIVVNHHKFCLNLLLSTDI